MSWRAAGPEKHPGGFDLDWGQDMKRLGERLRSAGAEWVMFTQFALADLQKEHGFPVGITERRSESIAGMECRRRPV